MKRMLLQYWLAGGLFLAGTALFANDVWQEQNAASPWYFGASGAYLDTEDDEIISDNYSLSLHIGRDISEKWSLEAILAWMPDIDENIKVFNRAGLSINHNDPAAEYETSAVELALEGLYHFTRWERFDPYLSVGAGIDRYSDDIGKYYDLNLRAGAGAMYHLNDSLALRIDTRTILISHSTQFHWLLGAGLVWSPQIKAARTPVRQMDIPSIEPPASEKDTDGDGLSDSVEKKAGTNPRMADSDEDGINDGDEINRYHTNPLNTDSDWDGLSDGREILEFATDPLNPDTDAGGVADGHEVIEDGTDPRKPSDDLRFFELQIQFEPGKWNVREEYYSELAVVGRILRDNPDSTARIEGHIDAGTGLSESAAEKLTRKRAAAVRRYLSDNWNIAPRRMKAVGYGTSRPRAKPDTVNGNPANRRVEVYIRMKK